MKRVAFLLLTSFACLGGFEEQSLAQFFDQHAAELKYYEQQIACLELYTGYLEKGYKIAQKGLAAIAEIKKGEFKLQQVFFNSFSTVNPQIAEYARITDILALQISIISNFKRAMRQTSHFSSSEISYLQRVYSNLSSECNKNLTELYNVITDGTLIMKDDKRINRIDNIYADMKDKYAFTQSFTSEASVLAAERANTQNDIEYLDGLE